MLQPTSGDKQSNLNLYNFFIVSWGVSDNKTTKNNETF